MKINLFIVLFLVGFVFIAKAQSEEEIEVFGDDVLSDEVCLKYGSADPTTLGLFGNLLGGLKNMGSCLKIHGNYCGPGWCDVCLPFHTNPFRKHFGGNQSHILT
jgi:hypothetical protein